MTERLGKRMLVQGNVATAEGAIQAGLKCYFGYPITPQNEIPEYLSWRLPQVGGVFLQAESELAGINMVMGASATGMRAMTSSSGPGISLMQEGISFIAGMRLPVVIINVMRCGPGLGGIKPSQGDYYQATRGGGHGDYHTIVLAPGNVQEMFDHTMKAFALAEKHRNPVIVLADGMIGQMKEAAILEPLEPPQQNEKTWALTGARGRPSQTVRSMYLDGDGQEQLNHTLEQQYSQIRCAEQLFETRWVDDADYLLVAFGMSARIALTAARQARKEGLRVGLFRPISLFPFPVDGLYALSKNIKRMLAVEMNLGQMIDDVRAAVASDATVGFCGRAGGGVPTTAEIIEKLKEL